MELVLEEGAASAGVVNGATGEAVWVDADDGSTLSGYGTLTLGFAAETCTAGGLELSRLVRPASSFFALAPGVRELAFPGCASHFVTWRERWA